MKPLISLTSLLALVCAVVLAVGALVLAGGTAERQPSKSLDLRSLVAPSVANNLVLHGLRVGAAGLYFQVAQEPTAVSCTIVHTDLSGAIRKLVSLPLGVETPDFDVDDSGRLTIRYRPGASSEQRLGL